MSDTSWKTVVGAQGLHKDGVATARVVATSDPHAHDVGHCVAYVFARTEMDRERRSSLIAAAPDLLAALEVALATMEATMHRSRSKQHPFAEMEQARAAIAKARGES